jgi:hypothetical protein
MVKVCFKWGAFHWETNEIEALSASIDAFQRSTVSGYLGLTGDEDIFIRSVYITSVAEITEEAREAKPPSGITFLDLDEVRTIGAGRELLQYKVQFSCDINEVFYNLVFYVSMIVTPNIKSLQSVAIELLQCIPPSVRAGFDDVTEKEYLVYGKKPILVVT